MVESGFPKLYFENSWQFLKRLNIELLYDPAVLLHMSKRKENIYLHRNLYTNDHRNIIHKRQKSGNKPKCLSTNEWINRISFGHKRNEILDTYYNMVEPENIIPSESSQLQ